MEFDCIVIGKGLIGSAAAKYLSHSLKKVAVVGPNEPSNLRDGIVFSSHYDEGRIQRIMGVDETWTRLNQQSSETYLPLQQETGIHFHDPVGCLYVNPHGEDPYLKQVKYLSQKFNHQYEDFQDEISLRNAFPDFHFPKAARGIFEGAPSGFINPRLLIKAQLDLFTKNKGSIISEVVASIRHANGSIEIKTIEGSTLATKKILVAAGAFTNSLNLLSEKLSFKLKSETTLLAKVSKEDAIRLKKLPSLLYEISSPEIQNIYLLQPILYPDGEYYLKLGGNIPGDLYFEKLQDIQQWFYDDDPGINLEILRDALTKLMPELNAIGFKTKKCIVSRTVHGKPYIGALREKGVFVAAGGNGYGAMCSDALGKLASHVVINNAFPKEFPEEEFLPNQKIK